MQNETSDLLELLEDVQEWEPESSPVFERESEVLV
jgi:hypothetical protein